MYDLSLFAPHHLSFEPVLYHLDHLHHLGVLLLVDERHEDVADEPLPHVGAHHAHPVLYQVQLRISNLDTTTANNTMQYNFGRFFCNFRIAQILRRLLKKHNQELFMRNTSLLLHRPCQHLIWRLSQYTDIHKHRPNQHQSWRLSWFTDFCKHSPSQSQSWRLSRSVCQTYQSCSPAAVWG